MSALRPHPGRRDPAYAVGMVTSALASLSDYYTPLWSDVRQNIFYRAMTVAVRRALRPGRRCPPRSAAHRPPHPPLTPLSPAPPGAQLGVSICSVVSLVFSPVRATASCRTNLRKASAGVAAGVCDLAAAFASGDPAQLKAAAPAVRKAMAEQLAALDKLKAQLPLAHEERFLFTRNPLDPKPFGAATGRLRRMHTSVAPVLSRTDAHPAEGDAALCALVGAELRQAAAKLKAAAAAVASLVPGGTRGWKPPEAEEVAASVLELDAAVALLVSGQDTRSLRPPDSLLHLPPGRTHQTSPQSPTPSIQSNMIRPPHRVSRRRSARCRSTRTRSATAPRPGSSPPWATLSSSSSTRACSTAPRRRTCCPPWGRRSTRSTRGAGRRRGRRSGRRRRWRTRTPGTGRWRC